MPLRATNEADGRICSTDASYSAPSRRLCFANQNTNISGTKSKESVYCTLMRNRLPCSIESVTPISCGTRLIGLRRRPSARWCRGKLRFSGFQWYVVSVGLLDGEGYRGVKAICDDTVDVKANATQPVPHDWRVIQTWSALNTIQSMLSVVWWHCRCESKRHSTSATRLGCNTDVISAEYHSINVKRCMMTL